MRILVVQREVALARKIAAALIEAGHDPMVVHDAAAGIKEVIKGSFDLIVLDVGRRQADTFEFLRQLRAQRVNSRILILTAWSEITDCVTALQSGADDYLSKPFAMSELIARANALGRRYLEQPRFTLRVGDLTVDLADHQVHRADKKIELSLRQLALLKVLMREPGRAFTRRELHERVWKPREEYDPKLVEVFIGRLRRKLGDPPLIRTAPHIGYSIEAADDNKIFPPSKVTRVLPNSCRNKGNFRADEQIAVPQIPSNK